MENNDQLGSCDLEALTLIALIKDGGTLSKEVKERLMETLLAENIALKDTEAKGETSASSTDNEPLKKILAERISAFIQTDEERPGRKEYQDLNIQDVKLTKLTFEIIEEQINTIPLLQLRRPLSFFMDFRGTGYRTLENKDEAFQRFRLALISRLLQVKPMTLEDIESFYFCYSVAEASGYDSEIGSAFSNAVAFVDPKTRNQVIEKRKAMVTLMKQKLTLLKVQLEGSR